MIAPLFDELRLALLFLTRLPVGAPARTTVLGRALAWAPLAGAAVGLLSGLAGCAAGWAGLPPGLAALLALATSIAVTGALHEDGLADCADGLGGGRTREAKLAILRDSRIGSYGALALMLSVGLRTLALAALPPACWIAVLVAAHGWARALLPAVPLLLPPAREDGLGAAAAGAGGRPALLALLLGGGLVLAVLGPAAGSAALLAGLLPAVYALGLVWRHLRGYTGDALGMIEQAAETGMMIGLAAWFAA